MKLSIILKSIMLFSLSFFVTATGVNMLPIIVANSEETIFNFLYALSIMASSAYFFYLMIKEVT